MLTFCSIFWLYINFFCDNAKKCVVNTVLFSLFSDGTSRLRRYLAQNCLLHYEHYVQANYNKGESKSVLILAPYSFTYWHTLETIVDLNSDAFYEVSFHINEIVVNRKNDQIKKNDNNRKRVFIDCQLCDFVERQRLDLHFLTIILGSAWSVCLLWLTWVVRRKSVLRSSMYVRTYVHFMIISLLKLRGIGVSAILSTPNRLNYYWRIAEYEKSRKKRRVFLLGTLL